MSTRHHLEALDVFRGATIAAMILVNNPGDWSAVYLPLLHSAWDGCTVTDLVFPFFVFIMGCAMSLAFARRDEGSREPWRAGARVARRAATLLVLGLILNLVSAMPAVTSMRVPGVLQRIGLAYFAAALIVRRFGAMAQGSIAMGLIVCHWALLTLVPFDGGTATSVTRAHNLAGYVDTQLFGRHTLMPGFDPEGMLGTMPTVATALAGALAAQWLRRQADSPRRALGLVAGGAAAIGAGLAWSTKWPINKPLWSGSYVLLTAGFAAIALAACLYLVDVRTARRAVQPFLWLGVNPLAIYFGSELVGRILDRPLFPWSLGDMSPKEWIYSHWFTPGGAGGEWPSLVYAVAFTVCWVGLSALLYRRGVRIRV